MKSLGLWRFVESIYQILVARPRIPKSLEDNELINTILSRRSVRSFLDRDISNDVMSTILEAGRLAPSTVNLQSWSFGVFTATDWKRVFGTNIPFKAPRAILIMGDTHRVRKVLDTFPDSPLVEYTIAVMNASLAAMNMNIAAEALGVSSVMLSETGKSGLLDADYLKKKLSLPESVFPIMTLVLGYAKSSPPPMPPKLPLDELVFTESYQETQAYIMRDWLNRLEDGYKASNLKISFDSQLKVYQSKIGKSEADLYQMVFGKTNEQVLNQKS